MTFSDGPLLEDAKAARHFFREKGYLIARNLIPATACKGVLSAFQTNIKPSDALFMRQTTTRAEKHNLSAHGLMTNPMLDVHEITEPEHQLFRDAALDVFTSSGLNKALSALLDDEPVMVQSMYFESSRGTDAHVDSHFIDATEPGRLIGAWIAVQDIDELGGRFCVYPESNRLAEDGVFDAEVTQVAQEYERQSLSVIRGYQLEKKSFSLKEVTKTRRLLMQLIKQSGVRVFAPPMNEGDVLFFSSQTLHGSLKPGAPTLEPGELGQGQGQYSRNSLTCHWVPKQQGLMRYRKVVEPMNLNYHNQTWIHQPQTSLT